MRPESRSVCHRMTENLGTGLVATLPFGRFYGRIEKPVVHLKCSSEMARQMRRPWHDTGGKNVAEHPVPAREIAITQPANKSGTAEPERACAVENQSSDGVRVFAVSRVYECLLN